MAGKRQISESQLEEHLAWYLTSRPTPIGRLEAEFGHEQCPEKQYSRLHELRRSRVGAADSTNSIDLGQLIDYLEAELYDKDLKERAEAYEDAVRSGRAIPEFTLYSYQLEGQAALDAYVSQIVAAVRDFPFLQLAGGRAAGSWIRDELVAPVFDGHWDFYSNRKINNGFDLNEFYLLLDGENMLIQRLRYARKTLQM
ncbi:hypothetical protein AK812_SmicGene32109 [Symbiodinium microadriaticum]|uniref:Uncharacterized protein n=1 Tax=Symbiodinium microadriaticum TaxID=2951 RepID=A0A1Q9CUZ1_SYMMI|nr:hypothetical protein AK812_SmicGene32109 [Symbiodinium microadriaticum]CAE7301506.1 unnamed protein product [Symbiodinium microadriaticum]